MKLKTLRDLSLLVGIFGVIWLFFILFPPGCNTRLQITAEEEKKFGDLLAHEVVLRQFNNVRQEEPLLDSVVSLVTTRLMESGEASLFDYHFYILDDSTPNAFAIPGGHVFIFRGLFRYCGSAEELAGVLSHEIGHCEHRHSMRKLIKDVGLNIVLSSVTGDNSTQLSEFGHMVLSSRFSRAYEKDADDFAVRLLEKSGINPSSLALFFERLNEEGLDYSEDMEWMASHPHNNRRIKAIRGYQPPESFKERRLDVDWERVQEAAQTKY